MVRAPLLGHLLIDHGYQSSWSIALLGLATFVGEVSHLSAIKIHKATSRSLLWWPWCCLLWWWIRNMVELLLLLLLLCLELPLLVLWVIAPILLWRAMQLPRRWGIHDGVLCRSTTRPTTSRGSRHDPLHLLLFGHNNGLHCPLLVYGGTRQVIVGQV
jgi:hypothetical protein